MSKTYIEQYKDKLISAKKAAQLIKSNELVVYGSFLGRPMDFDNELAKRKEELKNVFLYVCTTLLPPLSTAICDPSHEHFTCNSFFFSALDRKLHDNNLMYYLSAHLGESVAIIDRQHSHDYTYVVQVSPMDEHGFFSFGLSNVYSFTGCMSARRVILEVNENMPRVPGGSEDAIHISMVDYVIEGSNSPLSEYPVSPEPDEVDCTMAKLLLEEIEDRACLQLGIGTLPDLLGKLICESDLKDLGIHTEMFCCSMVELFNKGLVTNKYKKLDRGKITFTFALGTKETYKFLENNPLMASHPADYANDPRIISLNDKVISINNAVEVDLFSQVCAESSGIRQLSGTGGQLDFVQGAWNSKGGKSILSLTSTYKDRNGERHSRIVPTLKNGSIVTTPRAAVDYLVTEYGVAHLKGKSSWERAELLIGLAHPEFRDDLIKEADKMKIWRLSNKLEL